MQQMLLDCVRAERTGWRDENISRRHRQWGFNCPAVDLDFMMAEYNYGKPVALVEYKHKLARAPNLGHPTYVALSDLANNYAGGALPFIVARYCSDLWWFHILPVNDAAKQFYGEFTRLSEQRFVRSLYALRKLTLTAQDNAAIQKLNTAQPPEFDA